MDVLASLKKKPIANAPKGIEIETLKVDWMV